MVLLTKTEVIVERSQLVLVACVFVFTLIGAVCDWRTRKLPNALVVTALGCALIYAIVNGAIQGGWIGVGMGLWRALGGFAVGFGVLIIPWLVGGGGGGDVKFTAAVGAWLGASQTFQMLFVAGGMVLIGTLSVLAWQFFTRGIRRTQERYSGEPAVQRARGGRCDSQTEANAAQGRAIRRRLLPFGVPIALATWCVLLLGELVPRS